MPIIALLAINIEVDTIGDNLWNCPYSRMSWLWLFMEIKQPAEMNSSALNNACVSMWKNISLYIFSPNDIVIKPNWLKVDKAIIFFMSFSYSAVTLDINIVEIPVIIKIFCVTILLRIKLLKRYRIKIPAVTNVDECTSADTGVGAAIAAGSHLEKGNWALLVIAAIVIPNDCNIYDLLFIV